MISTIDPARARSTDPETSHEAAAQADTFRSVKAVFDSLGQYGPLADFELVSLMHSLGYAFSPERIRTARNSLTKVGKIEHTGYYRLTPTNRRARVWAVTR